MDRPTLLLALTMGLLLLGNVLHIVGLATEEWGKVEDTSGNEGSFGLWEVCLNGACNEISESDKPGWLKGCGAMAILGMLAGVGALSAVMVSAFLDYLKKVYPEFIHIIAVIASIVSFVFILICVSIFAAEHEKFSGQGENFDLGYSFGLSITGAILILGGGISAWAAKHSQTF